jgi:hypothetical protein
MSAASAPPGPIPPAPAGPSPTPVPAPDEPLSVAWPPPPESTVGGLAASCSAVPPSPEQPAVVYPEQSSTCTVYAIGVVVPPIATA